MCLKINLSHKLTEWAINDVSTTNDAICAGEQERQKFHLYGDAPPLNVQ